MKTQISIPVACAAKSKVENALWGLGQGLLGSTTAAAPGLGCARGKAGLRHSPCAQAGGSRGQSPQAGGPKASACECSTQEVKIDQSLVALIILLTDVVTGGTALLGKRQHDGIPNHRTKIWASCWHFRHTARI